MEGKRQLLQTSRAEQGRGAAEWLEYAVTGDWSERRGCCCVRGRLARESLAFRFQRRRAVVFERNALVCRQGCKRQTPSDQHATQSGFCARRWLCRFVRHGQVC